MAKCEICGCDGPSRLTGFTPSRVWWQTGPGRMMRTALKLNIASLLIYNIVTCEDLICRMRASFHGVPGRPYPSGLAEVDEWIAKNQSLSL